MGNDLGDYPIFVFSDKLRIMIFSETKDNIGGIPWHKPNEVAFQLTSL